MTRILDALNKANFRCVATRLPDTLVGLQEDLSQQGVSYPAFEKPVPQEATLSVDPLDSETESLFKYFIDGSERTTTIGSIVDPQNQYFPLFVAQIGVATTKMEEGLLKLENYHHENILLMPSTYSPEDLRCAKKEIKKVENLSRMTLNLKVCTYDVQIDNQKDTVAEARKVILKKMHICEIDEIQRLVSSKSVTRDSLLMIDGALEFYEQFKHEDFRNVVGVSKQFNTNKFLGRGAKKKHAGSIVSALKSQHRTPAYKIEHRNLAIASWYLRLQRADILRKPEDGVVKVEVFPENPSNADSMDNSLCSSFSSHILALRHPTTPVTDGRWASHLYPVYLTERYAKTQFQKSETIAAYF